MKLSPAAKSALEKKNRLRRLTGGFYFDPTPGPYPGAGPIKFRPGETPEQRCFRRFPIDRHKARQE
jgi:hypothetical protein